MFEFFGGLIRAIEWVHVCRGSIFIVKFALPVEENTVYFAHDSAVMPP
jgi:hypothetical protein